ncbi:MAG: hypothetical protein ACXWU2_09730 [Allosphingosinicella sp.]
MVRDRRLEHLQTQPCLCGVAFRRKSYAAPGPHWDHDHCVACWAPFAALGSDENESVHESYATTVAYVHGAEYDWVCEPCFREFRKAMGWTIAEPDAEV